MLVYANALRLQGTGALDVAMNCISRWFSEQLGRKVSVSEIARAGEWKGDSAKAAWLKSVAALGEEPEMHAWVLKHPDSNVSGRQWQIDLGIKKTKDLVDFSCVTSADELSVLINQPVVASRPRLVGYLKDEIGRRTDVDFSRDTIGTRLKTVGDSLDSYRALASEIERPDRDYPLVIVSPHKERGYLIDPNKLQESVFGLAQVVQVFSGFNKWEMEAELGRRFSAWGGAINIIKSPRKEGLSITNPYFSDMIEQWGDLPSRLSRMLAMITHLTNVPKQRKRVSLDGVIRLDLTRKMLEQRRDFREKGGGEQAMIELLESGLTDAEEKIRSLQDRLENEEFKNELLKEEIELTEAKWARERFSIQEAARQQTSRAGVYSLDFDVLFDIASRGDQPTPKECLEVISKYYAQRVVILDSAIDSAERYPDFEQGRRLLGLLWKLVTEFIDEFKAGGDDRARKCFTPSEYAATESEGTQRNKDARDKRTFDYNGNRITMFRHLKIGVADDRRKSIRVYFEWISDEEKIVIGHCGCHLPVISH